MELKDLFYTWVPVWVKLLVLFIIFFITLTCNGVYLGNTTDMYSGLGVYPEPSTEAVGNIRNTELNLYMSPDCILILSMPVRSVTSTTSPASPPQPPTSKTKAPLHISGRYNSRLPSPPLRNSRASYSSWSPPAGDHRPDHRISGPNQTTRDF